MEILKNIVPKIERGSNGKVIRDSFIEALNEINSSNLVTGTSLGGYPIGDYVLKDEINSELYLDQNPKQYSVKGVTSDGLNDILPPVQESARDINGEDVDEFLNNDILVESIVVNGNSNLIIGESARLIAYVFPNNATNKSFIWSSSDPVIATVDKFGFVKALAKGTVIIKASSKDGSRVYGEFQIRVREGIFVSSIIITTNQGDNPIISSTEDEVIGIATIIPENADDKEVKWYTNDEDILTIDDNGLITPVSDGIAYIYCIATDGTNIESNWIGVTIENSHPQNFSLQFSDELEHRYNSKDAVVPRGIPVNLEVNIDPEPIIPPIIKWSYKEGPDSNVEEFTISEDGRTCIIVPYFQTYITIGNDDGDVTFSSNHTGLGWISVTALLMNAVDGEEVILDTVTIYEKYLKITNISITSSDGDNVSLIKDVLTTNKNVRVVEYSPIDAYNNSITWYAAPGNVVSLASGNDAATMIINLLANAKDGDECDIYCKSDDSLTESNKIHIIVREVLPEEIVISTNYGDDTLLSLSTTDAKVYISAKVPEVTSNYSLNWFSDNTEIVSLSPNASIPTEAIINPVSVGETYIYAKAAFDETIISNRIKVTIIKDTSNS